MTVEDQLRQEHRKHLYEALHAASRDYDQAILAVAAGTLAVSVTFAHDFTPTPVAGTQMILLGAWGLLILSLVAIVASFLTSQREIRRQIQALDNNTAYALGRAAKITYGLNIGAGVLLVLGLVLLGWYGLANVSPSPPASVP